MPSRPRRHMVTALLIAAAAAGCGSAAPAAGPGPEQRDITVDAVPAEGAAGLYIAQQDGLFAHAGLNVTIKPTENPTDDIPALLHGSAQMLSGQYVTFIAATANHTPMRIIAAGYALGRGVQEIMTGPHSAIRSAKQLRGATIAVNAPDSITTDLLYTALAVYRVTPAQVHIAVIPFPAMGAALAAHRVGAIYEVEPYVTEDAEHYGDVELADMDAGATLAFPVNGYGVLASWAASHPRTAAALARALEQGNRIAETNIAARQKALITALGLSPHVADVMAAGTFPASAPDRDQIQRDANMMLKFGQLSRSFDVGRITG